MVELVQYGRFKTISAARHEKGRMDAALFPENVLCGHLWKKLY